MVPELGTEEADKEAGLVIGNLFDEQQDKPESSNKTYSGSAIERLNQRNADM